MDQYIRDDIKLLGNEFITTFHPDEESVMILVTGDNSDFFAEGPAYVYLYKYEDGTVVHGIDSFVFFEIQAMNDFLEQLPTMSAFDFVKHGTGIVPSIS